MDTLLNKLLNIQHRFNPLHVHCRLVENGITNGLSVSICKWYEILVYRWLAWFTIIAVRICKQVSK
jgi:hypothetical protein